jgi:hypothetical protein
MHNSKNPNNRLYNATNATKNVDIFSAATDFLAKFRNLKIGFDQIFSAG